MVRAEYRDRKFEADDIKKGSSQGTVWYVQVSPVGVFLCLEGGKLRLVYRYVMIENRGGRKR